MECDQEDTASKEHDLCNAGARNSVADFVKVSSNEEWQYEYLLRCKLQQVEKDGSPYISQRSEEEIVTNHRGPDSLVLVHLDASHQLQHYDESHANEQEDQNGYDTNGDNVVPYRHPQ